MHPLTLILPIFGICPIHFSGCRPIVRFLSEQLGQNVKTTGRNPKTTETVIPVIYALIGFNVLFIIDISC